MKLWLVALFAAGLAGASALHSAPARPGPAVAKAASHCRPGEAVVYSCNFGKSVGSVCGSAGALHYRFGPAASPSLELSNRADWANVRVGSVRGQGPGGYQEHIRFTNGTTHYVVFSGANGELADQPGRTYSGIAVLAGATGERTLATLSCPGGARMAESLTDAARERAPDSAELDEEADGPFDAWF